MNDKKFLLIWFFYINSVFSLLLIFYWLGILQVGFYYDKSYLSYVIVIWWVISEIVIGLNILNQTFEFKYLRIFKNKLLESNSLSETLSNFKYKNSLVASHVAYIQKRYANSNKTVNQTQMASALERRLMNRSSFGWLASNLMVFLGLLGTVIGIVLTFWPFIDTSVTMDVSRIQGHLSDIFAGVGAAFFPSIYSAVFCVFILISDRIFNNSTHRLLNELTTFSETEILSRLENKNAN